MVVFLRGRARRALLTPMRRMADTQKLLYYYKHNHAKCKPACEGVSASGGRLRFASDRRV